MITILIDLKKIVLYIFLTSKKNDFSIKIILKFKNTFLKQKINKVFSFYKKII